MYICLSLLIKKYSILKNIKHLKKKIFHADKYINILINYNFIMNSFHQYKYDARSMLVINLSYQSIMLYHLLIRIKRNKLIFFFNKTLYIYIINREVLRELSYTAGIISFEICQQIFF